MIPILFRTEDTDFTTNGMGRLSDCTSCTVTEERNGIYELELVYPVTGRFYQYMISEGGIVGVIHDDKHDIQPFEIYQHSAPIDGVVTFNAHHISYNLGDIVVMPFEAASCAAALQGLKDNAVNACPFTFWTNKQGGTGSFTLNTPDNARALLGGQEGSILDSFGSGEYEFDKYEVKLYTKRGVDHGVTIRFGKNLTDIVWTYDKSGIYNAVVPYWANEETVVIGGLLGGQPDSPWTDDNGNQMTDDNSEVIYFRLADALRASVLDLSQNFEEEPTVQQLNDAARAFLTNNKPWIPNDNVEVDFVALWQSPEYEEVAALQRLSLCDYVSIYYPELGVVREHAEVISVVYNVLLERYDKLTIGTPTTTLSESIAKSTVKVLQGQLANYATKAQISEVEAAIDEASQKIIGGLGGYVVMTPNADGQPQEILIMDTDDINTAVHVIRLNRNGIGFSNNGYAGPYTSAWTIDGKFNADFIAAGTLLATYIKGGTLTLGGRGNGNGVLQVKDPTNGYTIGRWDNNGITIDGGKVVTTDIAGYGGTDIDHSYYLLWSALKDGRLSFRIGPSTISHSDDYDNSTEYAFVTFEVFGSSTPYAPTDYRQNPHETLSFANISKQSWYQRGFAFWGYKTTESTLLTRIATIEAGTDSDPFVAAINGRLLINARVGSIRFNNYNNWDTRQYNYDQGGVEIKLLDPTNPYGAKFEFTAGAQFDSDTNVQGAFTVSGTKNRVVKTDEYGDRLLSCYETPSPMFGDVGEGVVDDSGFCYVFLDPVFAETITTSQYQVFLQRYGQGDCYVYDRKPGYFVVKGDPGLSFGWELKAKQRDFDQLRLERNQEALSLDGTDYGAEGSAYYFNLQEGRIAQ